MLSWPTCHFVSNVLVIRAYFLSYMSGSDTFGKVCGLLEVKRIGRQRKLKNQRATIGWRLGIRTLLADELQACKKDAR